MLKSFPINGLLVVLLLLCTACANQDETLSSLSAPDKPSSTASADPENFPSEMIPDEEDVESALDSAEVFPDTETEAEPVREEQSQPIAAAENPPAPADGESAGETVETVTESIGGDPPPQTQSPAMAEAHSMRIGASRIEEQLLQMINEERLAGGLEVLGMENSMQFAAQIRAEEALDSLSHTRPNGSPYHTAFDEAGFSYAGKWHGENLAILKMSRELYDESAVAEALFAEWKSSPGHYQNMLGDQFVQTGIGVYVQTTGELISIGSAQLFASL